MCSSSTLLKFRPKPLDKVLLVSGTRDWVVPSGPEAITPMCETGAAQMGHRLVLVKGADHLTCGVFVEKSVQH